MKTTMAEYRRGIATLHNLMDMLYVALLEAMPSAELAHTGAHGWRGYTVRGYKNLAHGHYFCEIYTAEPTVFLMEEFYNYGGFFYPWRVDFDLKRTDFFSRDANGQKKLLANFYREAVNEALEWQVSAKRQSVVPQKLWDGKTYSNTPNLEYPSTIHRITPEYITALEQQDRLLWRLVKLIEDQAEVLGKPKPYIQYNISGWNYRGFWMKPRTDEPEDVIPEGSFPHHFKIDLYENPTVLRYQGQGKELVLELAESYYFTLDEKNQESTMYEFIKPLLPDLF